MCESGFIGSCSTTAQKVTSTPVTATLTPNQTSLFYTVPSTLNNYIEFTYTICQNNSQLTLTFTLWGETGQNTQYTSGNALAAPVQATLGSDCSNLVTPFISFGNQPNGQPEMLVLGLTDNSGFSTPISISVSQRIVVGFLIYYYVLIALGSFIALFLIIGSAIFIVRRRRLRRMVAMNAQSAPEVPETNDITYFETEMPVFKAFNLGNDRNVCPICLMQIERNDLVRKTPCSHSFHSNCIDSWCLKNLNCPVCRQDLSREKINEKKAEPVVPEYHAIIEEAVEERPIPSKVVIEDKYDIR
jgi:hypothetical protein